MAGSRRLFKLFNYVGCLHTRLPRARRLRALPFLDTAGLHISTLNTRTLLLPPFAPGLTAPLYSSTTLLYYLPSVIYSSILLILLSSVDIGSGDNDSTRLALFCLNIKVGVRLRAFWTRLVSPASTCTAYTAWFVAARLRHARLRTLVPALAGARLPTRYTTHTCVTPQLARATHAHTLQATTLPPFCVRSVHTPPYLR